MVYSVPSGAEIYIDGTQAITPSGLSINTPAFVSEIPVGTHSVTFILPGYITETKISEIREGQWSDVDAILHTEIPKLKGGIIMQPKQFGLVHFDTQPRGASIIVDGQILVNPNTEESVKTPATVELIEGRRDFILRLEGSEDATGYVDVLAGTSVNIFRNLNPGILGGGERPQPQIFLTDPNTGILRIYSFPEGADTYINGRYVGKVPLVITDVPAGVTNVAWKMPGMMDEEKIVDIVEGTWYDMNATMQPLLPKLQSYLNEAKTMNETTNMNTMQEPYYPISPDIPCVFPETPGETATQGSLVITTYPPGGSIIMDSKTVIDLDTGEPITTPVQLIMGCGFHDLRFHLDGFFDEFGGVYITPGHISFIHKNFQVK